MGAYPPPAEILGRLDSVTHVLRSSIKKATGRARRFLRNRNEWDPYYAASRTRLEARRFILDAQLDITEDEDENRTSGSGFDFGFVPNIGLEIFCNGVVAKVLKKSSDPKCPVPISSSERRVGFYSQQKQLMVSRKSPGETQLSEWNAIYLWDCNSERHFSELKLVLPKSATKTSVQWHWIADIPVLTTGKSEIESGDDATQQVLIEDIPISLPEDEAQAGDNDLR